MSRRVESVDCVDGVGFGGGCAPVAPAYGAFC